MSIEARIDGADTLARTMRAAADDIDDLTTAHRAIGGQVVDVARGLAPVRTGRLRSSITADPGPAGVTITAGAPYAPYVHARNPFLADALDRKTAAAVDTITSAVEDALDTIQGA